MATARLINDGLARQLGVPSAWNLLSIKLRPIGACGTPSPVPPAVSQAPLPLPSRKYDRPLAAGGASAAAATVTEDGGRMEGASNVDGTDGDGPGCEAVITMHSTADGPSTSAMISEACNRAQARLHALVETMLDEPRPAAPWLSLPTGVVLLKYAPVAAFPTLLPSRAFQCLPGPSHPPVPSSSSCTLLSYSCSFLYSSVTSLSLRLPTPVVSCSPCLTLHPVHRLGVHPRLSQRTCRRDGRGGSSLPPALDICRAPYGRRDELPPPRHSRPRASPHTLATRQAPRGAARALCHRANSATARLAAPSLPSTVPADVLAAPRAHCPSLLRARFAPHGLPGRRGRRRRRSRPPAVPQLRRVRKLRRRLRLCDPWPAGSSG